MGYRCYFRCPSCDGLNRVSSDRLGSQPVCGRCQAHLDVTGAPLDVDDDAIDLLLARAPIPLLLVFVTLDSPACRQLEPTLARLGSDFAGRLLVLRVDAARCERKTGEFGIQAIPSLYLIQKQEILSRKQGPRPYEELKKLLDRYVQFYDPE
jgi:thioredoxin 2